MTRLLRMRLIADYLAATRNEIAVDEMLLKLAHLTPTKVGYLPRVPHWLSKGLRAPRLTRVVWRLSWVLWLAGGALAYFALELLKFKQLHQRIGELPPQDVPLAEGAVLGFSTRVCDVADIKRFPWLPTVWLICPWAPQHCLPKNALELPLMSLLTKSDLNEAFFCALRSTYALARKPTTARWSLQGYTALRWFMVRRAVDKLSGVLVTTEHFDRWAVLVDRSVRTARVARGLPRKLIFIQHGALGGLGNAENYSDDPFQLPARISCANELHTYNSNEEDIFRRNVFSTNQRQSTLTVHYFSPTITITGELTAGRPQLLFVGHPLCETFQSNAYYALRKVLDFDAFYKPHPKAPMSAAMANIGWTIIENPLIFPKVDLLISYPSTLVIEYEGLGIQASVHPLDIGLEALPRFIGQLLAKIKSISSSPIETT